MDLYAASGYVPLYGGPVEVDEDTCYLMNEDGSSGGGMVYFPFASRSDTLYKKEKDV